MTNISRRGARGFVLAALGIMATCGLMYYSAANVIAGIANKRAPALALSLDSDEPTALTALGEAKFVESGVNDKNRAELIGLAKKSLHALAANPRALRLLAMAQPEGSQTAEKLLLLSNNLSRRDAATQLLLVDANLKAQRVSAALDNYDAVLRTTPSVHDSMFTRLALASTEPVLQDELTQLFGKNPPWLTNYVAWIQASNLSGVSLSSTIKLIPIQSSFISDAQKAGLIAKLVAGEEYSVAKGLYLQASGGDRDLLIRNGGFSESPKFPPFDWKISDRSGIVAGLVLDGNEGELHYVAEAGTGGQIATQLLSLLPGRYALSVTSELPGQDTRAGQRWIIYCIGAPTPVLTSDFYSGRSGSRTTKRIFSIPDMGCEQQWISLDILVSQNPGGQAGSVNQVDIHKISERS